MVNNGWQMGSDTLAKIGKRLLNSNHNNYNVSTQDIQVRRFEVCDWRTKQFIGESRQPRAEMQRVSSCEIDILGYGDMVCGVEGSKRCDKTA
jgi:hypothetical protein